MDFFQQHKKVILGGGLVVAGLLGLVILIQIYRIFLGSRVLVPELTESVIGGRLKADNFTAGEHTLEFRARTIHGDVVSDTATFNMFADPTPTEFGLPPEESPEPTPTEFGLPPEESVEPTPTEFGLPPDEFPHPSPRPSQPPF